MSIYFAHDSSVQHIAGVGASSAGKVLQVQQTIKSCLLYTSPSPRDRTRSRMPSSA